jgi:hypothetical protein
MWSVVISGGSIPHFWLTNHAQQPSQGYYILVKGYGDKQNRGKKEERLKRRGTTILALELEHGWRGSG